MTPGDLALAKSAASQRSGRSEDRRIAEDTDTGGSDEDAIESFIEHAAQQSERAPMHDRAASDQGEDYHRQNHGLKPRVLATSSIATLRNRLKQRLRVDVYVDKCQALVARNFPVLLHDCLRSQPAL